MGLVWPSEHIEVLRRITLGSLRNGSDDFEPVNHHLANIWFRVICRTQVAAWVFAETDNRLPGIELVHLCLGKTVAECAAVNRKKKNPSRSQYSAALGEPRLLRNEIEMGEDGERIHQIKAPVVVRELAFY